MSKLKAYMMHGGAQEECASLVWAYNFRSAKSLAFHGSACCDGCDYTDVRGHILRNDEWLRKNAADQAKLAEGIPHVVDDVPSCEGCELWHESLNDEGFCESCAEDFHEH